jgi:hypothetical protein
MIILHEKSFDGILTMVTNAKRILIIGCNGCAGIYQVGGEKQALLMKQRLDIASKLKNSPLKTEAVTLLRQCENQIVSTALHAIVNEYDTILSMACGAGVQTLGEVFEDKIIIPANDTAFIGSQDRAQGKFYELCSACGNCVLFETGGICPITRCAKGLLNGPCGGMADGKCEVGGWVQDCAWVLIFDNLKKNEDRESFIKFQLPRDFRVSQPPREINYEVEEGEISVE